MNALVIVLGFILLTIGHQLPWVFVAAAGYLLGNLVGQQPFLGLSGLSLTFFDWNCRNQRLVGHIFAKLYGHRRISGWGIHMLLSTALG
jgi:hypothetical protein